LFVNSVAIKHSGANDTTPLIIEDILKIVSAVQVNPKSLDVLKNPVVADLFPTNIARSFSSISITFVLFIVVAPNKTLVKLEPSTYLTTEYPNAPGQPINQLLSDCLFVCNG
jgi:hypothetical protein